jgi:hypothetical protein
VYFDWVGTSFLQFGHSRVFPAGDPQFGQKLYEGSSFSEQLGQDRNTLFG